RRLTIKCAIGLREKGVDRGQHVAMMLPNVSGFLITWIALCRLGAVAVLVNTASTSTELERLLRATDVDFLVIDREYLPAYDALPSASRLRDSHLVVHGIASGDDSARNSTSWSSLLEGNSEDQAFPDIDLAEIASIQFTSGSSGVPKGCMLSHRYWLTLGKARSMVGPAPSRILIDTPMFYMGPLWRFMMAFYCGSTLCVAPRFSLSRLFDRILDNKIDFCLVTYPVAKLGHDPRLASSSLKWLVTYGLGKDLHAGLEQRFGVPVRELYGMTEIGSGLSMPVDDSSMVGSGSCGRPALFRQCKIVVDGREVPDGTPGELWITGPGLFSSYYRNDEATAAAFEGEWFKTGDLFSRDANGYYFMLGRIKDVIRRSGENISAAEVELAVNQIDGVLDAAAVPVPDPLRGEEVKIVVAKAPGAAGDSLNEDAIVRECQRVLSPFKVPRYVEFVDALPKTPTGKIDKNILKAAAKTPGAAVYDAKPDKKRTA
uniref:class I adenylate-forming enzyme family protein n=1 Tax=uncultured Caballeronia sp. TaxID=1827198 RepID=UPI0035CAFBE9